MKCSQNILLTTSLLVLATSMPAPAATRGCSFKKSVQRSGLAFDISSRPALGCAVQVVDISVRRGGKTFSRLRTDVDYLAEKVWATDLTGDGKPELVIASRNAGSEARGALDVYYLEGNVIRRASLPELSGPSDYRGGDSFHRDGRQIVRTIPVYNDGDIDNNSGGGNRTLRYGFKDGVLSVLVQPEIQPADAQSSQRPANEQIIVKSVSTKPVIKDITSTETVIEITADAPISTYTTMKLDKPERIAIDVPDGSSPLAGKRIKIDTSGISRARVGLNEGFLRIVLDSNKRSFPKHTVTTTDRGLKIVFGTE